MRRPRRQKPVSPLQEYLEREAIAAATGTAKTAKQAECEASQSGGDSRIARKDAA